MQADFVLDTMCYLIDACHRAEQEFLLYAQQTHHDDIRARMKDRANRAHGSVKALQVHIEEWGGKPLPKAAWLNAWQQWWVRARVALFGQSEQAWLRECNRTEVSLLQRYKSVMQTSVLPFHVQMTVDRQYHAWQRIHHQMRIMHSALKSHA